MPCSSGAGPRSWPSPDFARVLEVLGDLLEERPEYPTRYVARSFPEDWQLEQLRETGA